MIEGLADVVLHLDRHLDVIIQHYGPWTYALLFALIFAETGLVVTPFLPGDSLLFAAGTFAARGSLDVGVLFLTLAMAAVLGNTANYWIGTATGFRVTQPRFARWVNRGYLDRARQFYEHYGGLAIVLARFLPILRTFAPFVAGVARMTYRRFLFYNVVGSVAWVALFVVGGLFFGNLPVVRENFSFVVMMIVVISLLPAVVEVVRHRRRAATGG